MSKRVKIKQRKITDEPANSSTTHSFHMYSNIESSMFRKNLLQWFAKSKRDLPWRVRAIQGNVEERTYSVLVSEVMLQQTQVNTVIEYYKKWMARWPTFETLAEATPDEVNEMWSGLGYYARGKRLQEAAKQISNKKIVLPCSAAQLQSLSGVGRYTASAVASIVFGEKVAAVDGNVIRVLARHRVVGVDATSNNTVNEIWKIANNLVDHEEPGKFNEAMMELGAVVCTPKSPKCNECPVRNSCLAYKATKTLGEKQLTFYGRDVPDIEAVSGCCLCLPPEQFDTSLGVMNYPRKGKKAPPRKQQSVVWILQKQNCEKVEYFMVKRPDKGLLGNLWEFPCYVMPSESNPKEFANVILQEHHGIDENDFESTKLLGNVLHVFSHIHQTYIVFQGKLKGVKLPLTSTHYQAQKWINSLQFETAGISTAMRKVFALLDPSPVLPSKGSNRRNVSKRNTQNNLITSFYAPKSAK